MKGDNGLEFVEFAEGPTITRPGGLNANPRQFQPKMFQTGGERCPVAFFRQYISRRPPNLSMSGPFYLSIKYNRGSSDEIWYRVKPMGEKKINPMMKNIISETTLESSEKRFSNHSARKTLVSKMKKAILEWSSIAKVTGHRNIQSLDDYDEADEDEQRQVSWAISERNSTAKIHASDQKYIRSFYFKCSNSRHDELMVRYCVILADHVTCTCCIMCSIYGH